MLMYFRKLLLNGIFHHHHHYQLGRPLLNIGLPQNLHPAGASNIYHPTMFSIKRTYLNFSAPMAINFSCYLPCPPPLQLTNLLSYVLLLRMCSLLIGFMLSITCCGSFLVGSVVRALPPPSEPRFAVSNYELFLFALVANQDTFFLNCNLVANKE